MKKQKLILWGLTLVTVIALAACAAQPTTQPTTQPTATAAVVATSAVTEAAAAVEPTATTAPTATLEPTATATAVVEPTTTNENLPAPTDAAMVAGGKVVISLAKNTICRTGPATNYPSVASIPAGQQVNAVGKLENSTSYTYIENPVTPGTYCWVFSEGASLQGSASDLKVVKPLPSPTPGTNANFSIAYSGIQECSGGDYSFNIKVTNTDKLVWQSIKIYIVDSIKNKSVSYSSDKFEGWYNCHVDNTQGDLAKGEHVFISPYDPGHFDYNPAGGTFFIRVMLCSEKGLTGTCLNKEIKVQP